jgi:hypothetical protein
MSWLRSRWLWTALGVAGAYYWFSRSRQAKRSMRSKGMFRQAVKAGRHVLDGAVEAMRR